MTQRYLRLAYRHLNKTKQLPKTKKYVLGLCPEYSPPYIFVKLHSPQIDLAVAQKCKRKAKNGA